MSDLVEDPGPVVEGPTTNVPPEILINGKTLAAWPSKWNGLEAISPENEFYDLASFLDDAGDVVFLPSTGNGADPVLFARFLNEGTIDDILSNPEFFTQFQGVTILEAGESGIVGFEIDGKVIPTDVDPGLDGTTDSLLL